MRASVVIIDWRRPELTRRCLSSLAEQSDTESVDLVLVVNEADDAEVAAYRREFPAVVVVPLATNTGFAGGVQAGVEASTGDVVVLLNNDAVAGPDFLARGLRTLTEAGRGTAAVAARVELEGAFVPAGAGAGAEADVLTARDGRRWARSDTRGAVRLLNGEGVAVDVWGNGFDRGWLEPVASDPGWPEPLFGFSGGACFVRRDALDQVGGFDASLFMYYEDLDVSWRLRLAGWDVVAEPLAVAVHRHAGSSSSGSALIKYQSMRNRVAVVLRNGSASMVVRVLVRAAARAALDLAPLGPSHLTRGQWARLAGQLPRLVSTALAHRRRDGATRADRLRVERCCLAR
ncbi:glycosyltransferase family 2 protein [Frigoribacterium sp. CFBP 13729]|uniref:glycosyltransferase family 2 protein n=1 Tax=unclassified Frigoribacterium TaxID=2627005 RepID=UPI001781583E|nr:glycosyltransferase family 2 protein [Frigoribacterium sp. CFBP 8766]MBD8609697.1 glycosyltransferase family 2 protein [Frigoribacterium sp. CFBP 13729]